MWTMPVKAGTMHAIAVMDDSIVKPAQFAATSRFPDLSIVSGDGQTDTVGQSLADTLTVKVSWLGQPVAGLGVRWSSGGITNVVTDSNGLASTTYQLGTVSTIYHVSASLEGTGAPSVNFSETAVPGPPASFQWVQSASTLLVSEWPWTFGTQLKDGYGNPLDGAPVAWSLAGGDGDIRPNLSFADSDGLTWATVTFGHSVQPFVLTASAGGGLEVQDTLDLPDFVLYEAYGSNGIAPPPPSTAEVHVGDVVRWRAFGSLVHEFAPLGHPELAEPMTGNPPAFEHRFDEPGTFVWYCPLHENDTTSTYGSEHFTIVVSP